MLRSSFRSSSQLTDTSPDTLLIFRAVKFPPETLVSPLIAEVERLPLDPETEMSPEIILISASISFISETEMSPFFDDTFPFSPERADTLISPLRLSMTASRMQSSGTSTETGKGSPY